MQLLERTKTFALTLAASAGLGLAAQADDIMVTHYGITSGGYPYAVAMAKGFFEEEGVKVDNIISAKGGGEAVRNMLASGVAYGETNPGAIVSAVQKGAPLVMIADTMSSVGDLNWVVMKDSPLQSLDDLRGKKVGYTNPKSTTHALSIGLLDAAGLTADDVDLVKTGGFGEGMAALESGIIDVAPLGEPLYTMNKDKYRVLARGGDVLPLLSNVLAVTTKDKAEENREFIEGVIRARRKAVEFIRENPDEAAEIIAEAYKQDVETTKGALNNLLSIKNEGVAYIGTGEFHVKGIQQMLDLQKRVGAIEGDYDIESMIDTSFLPEDLQKMN